ncbi:MAG: hypothetical protein HAW63_03335 [Bdellovibrionaceae bacterium]|nr:hypothetical protein [Pseudobdellovibrionaceae bacterium]
MWKIYTLMVIFFVSSCGQNLPPNFKADIDQNQRVKLNVGQELVPKVDILFVIDNSGSMSGHQVHLKNQIQYYANEILKIPSIDFHIGVLGSDYLNGFTRPYLTRKTPNVLETLKLNLLLGSSGKSIEKFFDPVYLALNPSFRTGRSSSFLRKRATLNLIFITDTDDQSKEISATSFYNFLLGLKQDSAKVITFAAIIKKSSCSGEYSSHNIRRLKQFIHTSRGKSVNLCSNYAVELIELAKKVVREAFTFKLKEVPIYESIVLSYGTTIIPRSITEGWSYNPKTVSIRIAAKFFKKLGNQNIIQKLQLSYKRARPGDL